MDGEMTARQQGLQTDWLGGTGTSRVKGLLLSETDGRVEQLKVGSQAGREALTRPLVSALLVDLAPSS